MRRGCRWFLQKDDHAPAPGRGFPIQAAGGMKRYVGMGMIGGHGIVVAQGVALVIDAQVRAEVLFFQPQVAVSAHGNGKGLQHGRPRQDEIDELPALHSGFAEGELACDELGMVQGDLRCPHAAGMAIFVVDPDVEAAFLCGFNRQLHAVKPHLGQVGGSQTGAGCQTKTAKPLVGHFADLANDFVFFDSAVPDPKWHGPISNGRVDKIVGVHRVRGMRLAVKSDRSVHETPAHAGHRYVTTRPCGRRRMSLISPSRCLHCAHGRSNLRAEERAAQVSQR